MPDSTASAQALRTLYSDHHGWLFAWLRGKLGCRHSAEDLAQDTFLRIIASRDLLALREPRAFLTTTARRLMIDQSRRRQIEQAYLAELAVELEQTAAATPEQIHAAVEALFQISSALQGLPSRPRQAFVLHYLEEQTHRVIAEQLGVSTRMVQKYLVQALLHCHRALEG